MEIKNVNYLIKTNFTGKTKVNNKNNNFEDKSNGKKIRYIGMLALSATTIAILAIKGKNGLHKNMPKNAADLNDSIQGMMPTKAENMSLTTSNMMQDIRKHWNNLTKQAQKSNEAVQDGYGCLIYANSPSVFVDGSTKTNIILDLDRIPAYLNDDNPKVSHYPYILSKELRACGKAPDIIAEITTKTDGTCQAVEYSLLHLPDVQKTMNDKQVAMYEIPRTRIVATTTDYNQAGEITSQSKVLVKRTAEPLDITWKKKVGNEIHYYSGNKLNKVQTSSKYYPDSKVVKQTFRDSNGKQYIIVYDKTKKMDRFVELRDNGLFATNLQTKGIGNTNGMKCGTKSFNADDILATLKANRFSEEICNDIMTDVEKLISIK